MFISTRGKVSRYRISLLFIKFSVSWAWWGSVKYEKSVMIKIPRTRVLTWSWNWRWSKTRLLMLSVCISWIWTILWIINITCTIVYRIEASLFNPMRLICICFEVLIERFYRRFRSRIGTSFSFFVFRFIAKVVGNRMLGSVTRIRVFPNLGFIFVTRIFCLWNWNFKVWIIGFRKLFLRFCF